MTTLTIYTPNYDKDENVVNDGMSNKAFLDMDNQLGIPFNGIDNALEYIFDNNMSVDRIEFNYVGADGIQMFQKYNVAQ